MKNKKKLIVIIILIIIIGGCLYLFLEKDNSNKELLDSYNKSKKGDEVISYRLDLRIYGILNDSYVNKTIYVFPGDNELNVKYIEGDDEIDYVFKEGKVYKVKNDKLAITNSFKAYENPEIFMDGVDNLVTSKKISDEVIEDKKYAKYEVTFKKDFVNKMLKTTDIHYVVKKDVNGEILLDQDSRVYKVYYNITKDFTVFASYYAYSTNE